MAAHRSAGQELELRLMTQTLSKPEGRSCRPITAYWDLSEVPLKTQGEIQAAICERIARVEQEYLGRGPKDIQAHLIGDLLVVRLRGVLTAAEQQLVRSAPIDHGRNLLKQARTLLIETARPLLEAIIHEITGARVLSLHYDISTVTSEEVILFTLSEMPGFRETNRK
jgi:uncharacterized protein YbcI